MPITFKVDGKNTDKMFDNLTDLPEDAITEAYPFYKSKTTKRSGNARSKTLLRKQRLEIRSAYPYAGRLDDGWSKKNPDGFTDPTIDELDKIVARLAKRA